MTNKRFYVYTLAEEPELVFYVGKGQGRRVNAHELEARGACPCVKCKRIRRIWKSGGVVVRSIVFETDNEDDALQYERDLIIALGLRSLVNKTQGGEGRTQRPDGLVSVEKLQRQHRAYIREATKGLDGSTKRYLKAHLESKCEKALRRAIEEARWIEERVDEQMDIWHSLGIKKTRMDAYAEYGVHPKAK